MFLSVQRIYVQRKLYSQNRNLILKTFLQRKKQPDCNKIQYQIYFNIFK